VGRAEQAVLAHGVPLEDGAVRPTAFRFRPDRAGGELELVLREGRTRVVRRLAAALGLGVRRLVRTAYGPVGLGSLRPGESRVLGERELADLRAAIGLPRPSPLLR
jgi:23S rRNA pseudouridine2605 synthase